MRARVLAFAAASLSMLVALGCASIGTTSATATSAIEAASELPQAARLDVAVIEFDPGLPADGEPIPDGVYPQLREAEAKLLPVRLRRTLEQTGQWGSVSVLPGDPIASEVTVRATILHSDGSALELLVNVSDATGRSWFERKYRAEAAEGAYLATDPQLDPYQPMFNTIANAMIEARSELDAARLAEIAEIAELQFASRLSPEAFDGYLETDRKGIVERVRLPARDEPMLDRAAEARARDEMFADTLGTHYENFADRLEANYWKWRETSSQEVLAKEALRREQIARGIGSALVLAGALTGIILIDDDDDGNSRDGIRAGIGIAGGLIIAQQMQVIRSLGEQRAMHEEALRELAESFQSDVEPMVVELETTAVRLQGTAQAQYQEWQRLLRDVYRAENAIISDIYMLPRQPTEEIWIGDNTLPVAALP